MLRANDKPETRTIRFDMERVTIEDIVDIAAGSARAILSDAPEFRAAIARGADFLDRLLREDGTIYGVTTGVGDSCTVSIEPELVGELPRHLYTFHGCGLGEYLTAAQTRAVIATRLTSLCKGFSGVSFELLEQMVLLLERGLLPMIPSRRLGRRQRRFDAAVLSRRGAVRRGRSLPRRQHDARGGGARRSRHRAAAHAPQRSAGDHERHGGDDGFGLSRLCARRIFDPAGNSHHGDGLVCARRQRLSFRSRRCFR